MNVKLLVLLAIALLLAGCESSSASSETLTPASPTNTELFRKVVASVAAGTLPDMLTGLDSDIAAYVRLRALMPLDNYVQDSRSGLSASELEDIPPALAETMRIPDEGSTVYSLPYARGVMTLY